jgi:hypothetical protein
MTLLSTEAELQAIAPLLLGYFRLPFAAASIPGAYAETVVARVRGGSVLRTYDFVDVVSDTGPYGWQVKSTKADTPVTWKRAKIPNAAALISASHDSVEGTQALGAAVIDFCNLHVRESVEAYSLDEIGYCRVIVKATEMVYFERALASREAPVLFEPTDFEWRWSEPKKGGRKEQLQALHGVHRESGRKWWAAHLLGENQLHFSGEGVWWPAPGDPHSIHIPLPADYEKLDFDTFLGWFAEQAQTGIQQRRLVALSDMSAALVELLQISPDSDLALAAAEAISLGLRASIGPEDDISRQALGESIDRVAASALLAVENDDATAIASLVDVVASAARGMVE